MLIVNWSIASEIFYILVKLLINSFDDKRLKNCHSDVDYMYIVCHV